MTRALRILVTVLGVLVVGLPPIWGCFALGYRASPMPAMKLLWVGLWSAFSLAMLFAVIHGRVTLGIIGFTTAYAVLLTWWTHLKPTNDHVWADDVAQMTTGVVEGNWVTLHNVRNFDWSTVTDYTQRWETRTYDLERLMSVDMIMSYWTGPAIAHMLISFGFDDGSQVVFSVEIRRQKVQKFSEVGGFFKEFELSVIAADERDVIRLRTNVRGEDDYLYRLQLPRPAIRSLFLAYVSEANSLIETPRFYNTVTVNCTTLVYQMMKRIVGHLPLDYRLLFSGYLPEYVHSVGGLDSRYTLVELSRRGHITERALKSDRSDSFSADIRGGLTGNERPS
jgi:uncharacterized protein DUF4105